MEDEYEESLIVYDELKYNKIFKEKLPEEFQKLNTKRLLAYYKAERQRYNVSIHQYHYGLDNVEFIWDVYPGYKEQQFQYKDWNNYLDSIKEELNKREHIN